MDGEAAYGHGVPLLVGQHVPKGADAGEGGAEQGSGGLVGVYIRRVAVYRQVGPLRAQAGNAQDVVKVAVGEEDGHGIQATALDESGHLLPVVAGVHHGAIQGVLVPEDITVGLNHAQLHAFDFHIVTSNSSPAWGGRRS